jgi:phage terminase large subunit
MLIRTTAIRKILRLRNRIKIIQGGTSAGKTFGILPILISKAAKRPLMEISVVAESIPHLRRGALKDFLSMMKSGFRYVDKRFNKSLLRYDFDNGSYIEFFSADDSSKLRGARRDILYINECNNIEFEAYNELAIRTKREIYLDFNPANEFWVHTELKNEPDTDFVVLTYKDNEALDKGIVKEIEKNRLKGLTSSYWANWWNVYGLGEMGSLQGVVFSNWKQIDTIPTEARLLGYGVDFGYTADPTSIVEVYSYQTGLVNTEIAKKLQKNIIAYADSAEPKSIEEIRRTGQLIKGVTKGLDSVNFGIQIMQSQEYLVTSQSTNLIKELRSYCWDKDRSGKQINKPIANYNHAIDAVRYHEMESLGKGKNFGKYFVQ